jgi:small-conductance mechanosensitive channel
MFTCIKFNIKIVLASLLIFTNAYSSIQDPALSKKQIVPVVLSADTLFYIGTNIGPFTPQQRASAIEEKLKTILDEDQSPDSIFTEEASGISNILIGSQIIMSVTDQDAAFMGINRTELAKEYQNSMRITLQKNINLFSSRSLLISFAKILAALLLMIIFFWLTRKFFPKTYEKFDKWEMRIFKPVKVRSTEIISAAGISAFFIVLLKLIRLGLSLAVLYYFIAFTFSHLPWTHAFNIKPILAGLLLAVMISAAAFALLKALFSFFNSFDKKTTKWRGTFIKSVKVKNLEILSDERIVEGVRLFIKIGRFFSFILISYLYITFLFSLFKFTKTWASKLFGYIVSPLSSIILSFINYLPSLFTIAVIIFITRYVIKFIKFAFGEIEHGTVTFAKFPAEWAEPTFKIVRFLVIVFAAIVIFPYLPGSKSPVFQGISIFIGVLFSLGSTSAIGNIVGGVVITYMRPFKIGDRVKIADTIGDIVEKNLLITRIRTIKNVDITIPNSMVLGSHIINYSSSAKDKGLILHTTVTIGYDAPWRKVHELLKNAAYATENILREPLPFIFQTALDDFYVHYELNVYTDKPNIMAKIYSDLHQNIQDKFNEGGVEIMSSHYSTIRDGNQVTIPHDYLPKEYKAPAFRLFGINLFGDKNNKKE